MKTFSSQVDWVQCDNCAEWFHLICLRLQPHMVREEFFCRWLSFPFFKLWFCAFLRLHSIAILFSYFIFFLYILSFYRTRVRSLVMLVSNSLTHWLTDCCLVNLIDVTLACEDANSKLVDVVTVADCWYLYFDKYGNFWTSKI